MPKKVLYPHVPNAPKTTGLLPSTGPGDEETKKNWRYEVRDQVQGMKDKTENLERIVKNVMPEDTGLLMQLGQVKLALNDTLKEVAKVLAKPKR